MAPCPSLEELERLLDEQLPEADGPAISAHVSACAACQAHLDRLTADTKDFAEVLSQVVQPEAKGNGEWDTVPPPQFLAHLKDLSIHTVMADRQRGSQSGVLAIPGFEILNELGRGGMGVVYKARQLGLNRLVALKMILAGPYARPKDLARFRQEAAAVAQLHHPNIVQIFDIGEADGVAYFALEFVDAGSLAQRLCGDLQPLDPSVRLIEILARAIHFTHLRGIVHRDLKPNNILLHSIDKNPAPQPDADSEVADPVNFVPNFTVSVADHIPKITDFGLAKRLDDQSTGPHTGEVIGTPSYMAPEQAAGKTRLIGPATDVYALGAILYEMLTGRPPFKGATALDTVVQVLHEEPVKPSHLRPHLPRDLETICLKCLSKEPGHRYISADALANDLLCFRKGKPIHARPVSMPVRIWKLACRRPLTATFLAGMLLSAVLGFLGVTWQWQEATRARDVALEEKREKEEQRLQADQARAEAILERGKTQTALYFSQIAQSQLQWQVNNVTGAVQSLNKFKPLPGREDRRGWEWHYLQGLFHSDLFTLNHSNEALGGNAAFDPSGRTIVSVVGGHAADDELHYGELRVWEATTGKLLQAVSVPATAHRLAFRPDGRVLALASTTGKVMLMEPDTCKELSTFTPHQQLIAALAFSADSEQLATASWDHTVNLCSGSTGQAIQTLKGHTARVQSVAFHPDGHLLASGDWDGAIKIWETRTGQEISSLTGHKSPVYGVAFSPDGKLLASAGSNGNMKIWDTATGRVIQSLTARSGAVLGNCFSPDGRYLAYCGGDGTVRVWDIESASDRVIFRGHTAPVESVQFSPDNQRLVSCSPQEAAVKVWDFTRHPEYASFAKVRGRADSNIKVRDLTGRADLVFLGQTGPDLEALAFHADGKHLVSVAVGGKIQIWDATSGILLEQRTVAMCDELISPALLAVFSPGGVRLAARTRDDAALVKAWDVATGAEAVTFRGHKMPILCVRFSPDGRRLVTCACDISRAERPHEIKVWDAATGDCLANLAGHGMPFTAVFSPDSKWLAVGAQDGVVMLIDWAGTPKLLRLLGHQSHVAALAFRGDGRLLASAGVEDKMLMIWDLDGVDSTHTLDRQAVYTITVPTFMCDLAFTEDGRRLAGATRDVVKMWDVATRHEVLTLRGAPQRHWDPAFNPRLAFSPNGKRLVSTNWDESISMWDAGISDDINAVAKHQAARRLAADACASFWHLEEAEDCWEHHNKAAARFHFQRLGALPLYQPLQLRKDRLARELAD